MDVQCPLHPQFSKSAGPHSSPAIESGGAPSTHAQQPQTSSPLLSCMHPGACSCLLVVSPMYTFPQLQGILYTTQELMLVGNLSLTLESCALKVIPDLNAVLMLNLLHTRLMSSLRPCRHIGDGDHYGSRLTKVVVTLSMYIQPSACCNNLLKEGHTTLEQHTGWLLNCSNSMHDHDVMASALR